MYEYILVVYMQMDNPQYVGSFTSCAAANDHVKEYYADAKYTTCLHEDYMFLPKDFLKKEIK